MKLFQIRISIYLVLSFPVSSNVFYKVDLYLFHCFNIHSKSTSYFIEYIVLQGIRRNLIGNPFPKVSRSFEFKACFKSVLPFRLLLLLVSLARRHQRYTVIYGVHIADSPSQALLPLRNYLAETGTMRAEHAKNACANGVKLSFSHKIRMDAQQHQEQQNLATIWLNIL